MNGSGRILQEKILDLGTDHQKTLSRLEERAWKDTPIDGDVHWGNCERSRLGCLDVQKTKWNPGYEPI